MAIESLHITKEQLLIELRAGRERAERYDERQLSRHHANQAKWAATCRRALTKIVDLPEEELVTAMRDMLNQRWHDEETSPHVPKLMRNDVPSCPRSEVANFDDAIERIELDSRTKFVIANNDYLMQLIQFGKRTKRTVC